MRKILQIFQSILPFGEEDASNLEKIMRTETLQKGEYWISAGKRNQNIAFIEEGYLRKFYLKDGLEITDFFYFDNDFSADLPSILSNSTPVASIIAMQETKLTSFSYHAFNELCKKSLTLEHLHRLIIELTFLRFYKRSVSFILHTPVERYEHLILEQPSVLKKAAQYHIASYLGISPQHLSRLRGQKAIS